MKRLLVLGPFLSLGLVLVVLWALVLWFALIYPRALVRDVQDELSGTATNTAQEVDAMLREAEGNLRTLDLMLLTRRTQEHTRDATVNLLADTLREGSRGMTDLMLANLDGRLWRIPSGEAPYADLGPDSLLKELTVPGGRSVVIGAPLQLRPGARPVLPLATRLSVATGDFEAAIAFIDMDSLLRIFRGRLLQRQGMAMFLERDDGLALVRLPELPGLVGTNVRAHKPERALPPGAPASGRFLLANALDGRARILSYQSLQDYPLRLFVSLEEDRILAGYLAQRRAVLGFSLLISVIAVALMVWLTRLQTQARLREAEREATADASPMGLFRCDLDGRTVYANETYLTLMEQDRAHLAWGWLDRVPEAERDTARTDWLTHARAGEAMDRVRHLRRADGSELVVAVRTRPMRVDGKLVAHAGTVLDITEAARQQAAALAVATERQRSQAVMNAVAHSAAVRMIAVDNERLVLFCNRSFEQRFGIAHRSWEGRHAREVMGDRYEDIAPLIDRALSGEDTLVEIREPASDGRGEPRYMELHYSPLYGEGVRPDDAPHADHARGSDAAAPAVGPHRPGDPGVIIGAFGVARDVTDAKQEQLRLLKASNTDPLTELLNRSGFAASITQALQRARDRRELVALLYLDLDRFKPVNDDHGHPVGDALLKAVAGRLRHALRPQDLVARLGGDEFAVFLHHVAQPDDAQVVADKLVQALALPFRIGALELRIGTSVGFCVNWATQVDVDALVAQADQQLYHAKRAGRGRAQGSVCAGDLNPLSPPPAA